MQQTHLQQVINYSTSMYHIIQIHKLKKIIRID